MGSIGHEESPVEVAIIGGGIAGVTLALGLISRSINVRIYERGRSFREIGAGIGFTSNAEWAMKVCDPRIHAAFKHVAVQNASDWFTWVDGGYINDSDPTDVAEPLVHKMYLGERGFEGCHRAMFLDELVKLMPDGMVEFEKNLDIIEEKDDDGKLRIKFLDGTIAEADVVIGCDGIRSRVRQLILGEKNPASYPSYSHKFAFRGLIPIDRAIAALGEEKTSTRHMHLGPNGLALTFPVAGGTLLNVAAFAHDPSEWPSQEKLTAPATRDEAVIAFKNFGPAVRAIMELLPDQLDKWAVFDTHDNPAPTYVKGRVCVSGDAAHASAPYHGAGAGFAIEDAAVLAHLLAAVGAASRQDAGKRKADLLKVALTTYNDVRLERSQWLVNTSRFVGDMYQWRDPQVGKDREKAAAEIEWRSRRIWDYDIDGMIKESEEKFKTALYGSQITGSAPTQDTKLGQVHSQGEVKVF